MTKKTITIKHLKKAMSQTRALISQVTSAAAADIAALKSGKQDKPLKGSFTIPTSGWSTDSTTGYTKFYDITVDNVTVNDRAEVIIAPGSVNAAAACGMCPVSETMAGKIRIRATRVPTAAIAAQYWIEKSD